MKVLIGEWKAGRNKSFLLYIDEIAKYFDVSPTYLLRGEEGEETKFSKDERELVLMYRCLHQESKDKLMATAETLVSIEKNNTK